MDEPRQLNERERLILQAVVHAYITTAEPAGSRAIVKRFNLDVSAATVRNVMADLEEYGYLQQIHTSSGRVPTDRGYRYYVDHLMRVQELTLADRARIEQQLSDRLADADELLRHTSHMLALISHHAGAIEAPDAKLTEVRQVELMPLSERRLAVLVADNCGGVHTMAVNLDESIDGDELSKLTRFMNEHLRGVATDQLTSQVHRTMQSLLNEQRILAERALKVLDLLPARHSGQLFLEGASQLFVLPEFSDVAKAREVFGALEERDRVAQLLRAAVERDQTTRSRVVIGSETRDNMLGEISIIASPYRVGDRTVGALGVLGPRRMQYSKLTAIVDYTANMVSRLLTRLAS